MLSVFCYYHRDDKKHTFFFEKLHLEIWDKANNQPFLTPCQLNQLAQLCLHEQMKECDLLGQTLSCLDNQIFMDYSHR